MAVRSDENKRSPLKAWVRALERTAAIERDRTLTLPLLIGRLGERLGDAPALLSSATALSYRSLAAACNRYARWGLARGLSAGDVVCLVMENCPDYMAIWLGLSGIGTTVALINTHLTGELLAHSLNLVAPRNVIAGPSLCAAVRDAARVARRNDGVPARRAGGCVGRRVDTRVDGSFGRRRVQGDVGGRARHVAGRTVAIVMWPSPSASG